jgi:Ca2+-binding RTX toxin-like protein
MTRQVHLVQRVEAGAVALVAIAAAVALYPDWWWVVPAAFLAFDLSMLGYARSTAAGAMTYNSVHNYAFPALAGLVALAVIAVVATPALAATSPINNNSVGEGDLGKANALTFQISGTCESVYLECTLKWQTADGSATLANNDYTPVTGNTSVGFGAFSIPVSVFTKGDKSIEGNETLRLAATFTDPEVSATPSTVSPGTGTIIDDDGGQLGTSGPDKQIGFQGGGLANNNFMWSFLGNDTQRGGLGNDFMASGFRSTPTIFPLGPPSLCQSGFSFPGGRLFSNFQKAGCVQSCFAGVGVKSGPYGTTNIGTSSGCKVAPKSYDEIAKQADASPGSTDDTGPDDDRQFGGRGVDFMYGHVGNDFQKGGPGMDLIIGGFGNDHLIGGGGRDLLFGGGGDDRLDAADGRPDFVRCGHGNDRAQVDAEDNVRACERESIAD